MCIASIDSPWRDIRDLLVILSDEMHYVGEYTRSHEESTYVGRKECRIWIEIESARSPLKLLPSGLNMAESM